MERGPRRDANWLAGVIVVDTSAWIEFLRGTGSPACELVDDLLDDGFVTCDPVVMEVLAGARDDAHLAELRGLLGRGTSVSTTTEDFEAAAAIYRACRRRGLTPRGTVDCLIAAIARRGGYAVLSADRDFGSVAAVARVDLVAV